MRSSNDCWLGGGSVYASGSCVETQESKFAGNSQRRMIKHFTCFPWKMVVLMKHNVWLGSNGKERQEEEEAEVVPSLPCPGNDPNVIF